MAFVLYRSIVDPERRIWLLLPVIDVLFFAIPFDYVSPFGDIFVYDLSVGLPDHLLLLNAVHFGFLGNHLGG